MKEEYYQVLVVIGVGPEASDWAEDDRLLDAIVAAGNGAISPLSTLHGEHGNLLSMFALSAEDAAEAAVEGAAVFRKAMTGLGFIVPDLAMDIRPLPPGSMVR